MLEVKSVFLEFVRHIVNGEIDEVSRELAASPILATAAAEVGAARHGAPDFFFSDIAHYLYAGDTALHMAAAAFRRPIAMLLVAHGADCHAKNRRGAQPLHYAADANHWEPTAQVETIEYLLSVGADPNALDNSGVAPLHRAVRTRSLPAVRALLDGGANPRAANKAGSTPLHLAVHATGRGGSGSEHARQQQKGIITLLLERAADPTDRDGRGTHVRRNVRDENMKTSGAIQGQPASELISRRIAELGDWRGKTLSRMRKRIHEADPDVVEEWKWMGTPVWSHDGIICTGESYKKVVKLTFIRGASLKDPGRLFNSSLDGNVRRAIDIHEGEDVDAAAFKALIRQAVALNKSGKSKASKKATS